MLTKVDTVTKMEHLMNNSLLPFQWEPQPQAAAWLEATVQAFLARLPAASTFAEQLYDRSGVRFTDLIDTVLLSDASPRLAAARQAGWTQQRDEGRWQLLDHPQGLFPTLAIGAPGSADRIAIDVKVEAVADFLAAHALSRPIVGEAGAPRRWALVFEAPNAGVLGVVERHGWRGIETGEAADIATVGRVLESFRARRRNLATDEAGFAEAAALIDAAIAAVGQGRACHLFFVAEREYWGGRNRAARAQKARQDAMGIGWANHDHHTYRSSRGNFVQLVELWEKLGFHCRERFYAGQQAGWGAQVMEQPTAGIVTFNDVDLTPDELFNDFAHEPLEPQEMLGTVGLWCGLHGDSFLQAGMHHLECQFDFDAVSRQLEQAADVRMMKPFTDLPHLRQAFTEGERWPAPGERIDALQRAGLITQSEAEQFRGQGAVGSHLENLERHAGFKGFNQEGVSEIIAATDPRRQRLSSAS